MASYAGNLRKMKVEHTDPVTYHFRIGEELVPMNDLVGSTLTFQYAGRINCKKCGRETKKSFAQGFCYPCFMNAPENSPCIIRPELCEGHLGKGRDPAWEATHHVKPHVVYLAVSSGIKVGVTRHDQVPIRWIDQGAWKVIHLAETSNRFEAGEIEVALKDHISDKTHWQKMLKNVLAEDLDLIEEKDNMAEVMPEGTEELFSENDEIYEFNYPVIAYPEKVKSMTFDKLPEISGALQGIKGQYLIFDEGRVLNIRKHTGYWVEMEV